MGEILPTSEDGAGVGKSCNCKVVSSDFSGSLWGAAGDPGALQSSAAEVGAAGPEAEGKDAQTGCGRSCQGPPPPKPPPPSHQCVHREGG